MRKCLVATFSLAVCTSLGLWGQNTGNANRETGNVSSADKRFVTKAAEGGLAEVELGNLAQSKAENQKVKDFAQRMVTDHSKANQELKSIAEKQNVTLPTQPDSKQRSEKDRLEKMSGASFDRSYIDEQVRDHEKDVAEFRQEANSGKDPEVKQWAQNTLPILEEHLKLAKEAQREVQKTGK